MKIKNDYNQLKEYANLNPTLTFKEMAFNLGIPYITFLRAMRKMKIPKPKMTHTWDKIMVNPEIEKEVMKKIHLWKQNKLAEKFGLNKKTIAAIKERNKRIDLRYCGKCGIKFYGEIANAQPMRRNRMLICEDCFNKNKKEYFGDNLIKLAKIITGA